MTTEKKLTKSSNKMIGGVVAGIAEYFGWDVTWTRIGYTFLSILSAAFPGILVYIILMLIMPEK
jgi:phage shock protein C